ncbi:MAG: LamG domain-containing protein, partial [Candidatus Aenigmarchaeota archaeon]|nr:LamG domain-containing protein [Candidatus Aenigmarchaeota archaeon]
PGGAYCSDGDIKVYALNNGDSAITANDVIVAQVDGVDVLNTPFFGDMKTGLTAYWKFDDNGGSTAKDSSTRGNDGTLVNNPQWVAGKSRSALKFTAANQYVVKDWADFTVSNLAIEFWMRPDVVSTGWRDLIGIKTSDPTRFHMDTSDNSIIWYQVYGGGSLDSNVVPIQGKWYHVTGTHDGTTAKIYINGELKNSGNLGTSALSEMLKAGSDAEVYNGVLDEIKVYTKSVGDVNIQPSASGIVINYPGIEGRHTVRVGTPSSVAETTVNCL